MHSFYPESNIAKTRCVQYTRLIEGFCPTILSWILPEALQENRWGDRSQAKRIGNVKHIKPIRKNEPGIDTCAQHRFEGWIIFFVPDRIVELIKDFYPHKGNVPDDELKKQFVEEIDMKLEH